MSTEPTYCAEHYLPAGSAWRRAARERHYDAVITRSMQRLVDAKELSEAIALVAVIGQSAERQSWNREYDPDFFWLPEAAWLSYLQDRLDEWTDGEMVERIIAAVEAESALIDSGLRQQRWSEREETDALH